MADKPERTSDQQKDQRTDQRSDQQDDGALPAPEPGQEGYGADESGAHPRGADGGRARSNPYGNTGGDQYGGGGVHGGTRGEDTTPDRAKTPDGAHPPTLPK